MSHATSAIESRGRIINRRLGLWLFMLSETFLFGGLIVARYFMNGTRTPDEVNQFLGLIITLVLLVSSFFANRGEVAAAHGDNKGFVANISVTIVLGIAFLLGVVIIEWPEAIHFAHPSTGYGTSLFSLTGLHAFHVLTGLIILTFVMLQGKRGHYSEESHWDVEGAVVYWHFVDVAWVILYPTLYLIQ